MKFNCPHCGQHLEADDDMVGSAIACPACNEPLTVPQPEPPPNSVRNNKQTPDPAPQNAACSALCDPEEAARMNPAIPDEARKFVEKGGGLLNLSELPEVIDALEDWCRKQVPQAKPEDIAATMVSMFDFNCVTCGPLQTETVLAGAMGRILHRMNPEAAVVPMGPNVAALFEGKCPRCRVGTLKVTIHLAMAYAMLSRYETCHFCGRRPGHAAANVRIEMHGGLWRDTSDISQRLIRWKRLTLDVPRCQPCMMYHRKCENIMRLGATTSFVCGGLVSWLLWIAAGLAGLMQGVSGLISLPIMFVPFFLGIWMTCRAQKSYKASQPHPVKDLNDTGTCSTIVSLNKLGWYAGSHPSAEEMSKVP